MDPAAGLRVWIALGCRGLGVKGEEGLGTVVRVAADGGQLTVKWDDSNLEHDYSCGMYKVHKPKPLKLIEHGARLFVRYVRGTYRLVTGLRFGDWFRVRISCLGCRYASTRDCQLVCATSLFLMLCKV